MGDFPQVAGTRIAAWGRLVIVLPGLDDNGVSGFEDLFDHANAALAEMVDEGAITKEERERIVLGAYPRRKRDLLAPFKLDGQLPGLIVEHCEMSVLQDAAWVNYQQDGNKELLAAAHAQFFRATFMPSLAAALMRTRNLEAQRTFGDRLEQGLKRHLERKAVALNSHVQTIVLAKTAS